jgi:hypothetical protein
MSEIEKYKKYLNFKANPRYLRRDFMVPLYTGTEPDIVPETSIEQQGTVQEFNDGGVVERKSYIAGGTVASMPKELKSLFKKEYPNKKWEDLKYYQRNNLKSKFNRLYPNIKLSESKLPGVAYERPDVLKIIEDKLKSTVEKKDGFKVVNWNEKTTHPMLIKEFKKNNIELKAKEFINKAINKVFEKNNWINPTQYRKEIVVDSFMKHLDTVGEFDGEEKLAKELKPFLGEPATKDKPSKLYQTINRDFTDWRAGKFEVSTVDRDLLDKNALKEIKNWMPRTTNIRSVQRKEQLEFLNNLNDKNISLDNAKNQFVKKFSNLNNPLQTFNQRVGQLNVLKLEGRLPSNNDATQFKTYKNIEVGERSSWLKAGLTDLFAGNYSKTIQAADILNAEGKTKEAQRLYAAAEKFFSPNDGIFRKTGGQAEHPFSRKYGGTADQQLKVNSLIEGDLNSFKKTNFDDPVNQAIEKYNVSTEDKVKKSLQKEIELRKQFMNYITGSKEFGGIVDPVEFEFTPNEVKVKTNVKPIDKIKNFDVDIFKQRGEAYGETASDIGKDLGLLTKEGKVVNKKVSLNKIENILNKINKIKSKSAVDLANSLDKKTALEICNKLSGGGVPGDCLEVAKREPETFLKAAAESKDIKTASNAARTLDFTKKALSATEEVFAFGKGVVGRTLAPLAAINSGLEQFTAGNYREAYRQVFDFLDPLPLIGITGPEKARQEGSIENVRGRIKNENQESFNRLLEFNDVYNKLEDVNTRLERAEYATQDPNAAPESYDPDYINDLKKQQKDLEKIVNSSRYQNISNYYSNVVGDVIKETFLRNKGRPDQEKYAYETATQETFNRFINPNLLKELNEENKGLYKNITASAKIFEDQSKIPMSDAQRTAIESMGEFYSPPEQIEVLPQQKTEIPFIEEQEELPSEYIVSAADGGRIGLSGGGGPKIGRRGFLGLIAGAAAAPDLIKSLKGTGQAAKIASKIKLEPAEGMYPWFPKLVEKVKEMGKPFEEKDLIMEPSYKNDPRPFGSRQPTGEEKLTKHVDGDTTFILREYPDGRLAVDIDSPRNQESFGQPVSLYYRPKMEIQNYKGEKKIEPPEFKVLEPEPRLFANGPDDVDITFTEVPKNPKRNTVFGDIEAAERFATGNIKNRKIIPVKQSLRNEMSDDPSTFIMRQSGELGSKARPEEIIKLPEEFASGGRVKFSGGGKVKFARMITDILGSLRQKLSFSSHLEELYGTEKAKEKILSPYRLPEGTNKSQHSDILMYIDESRQNLPKEYNDLQNILNEIEKDISNYDYISANKKGRTLLDRLPESFNFEKLSLDQFPMEDPLNNAIILMDPQRNNMRGRFVNRVRIDPETKRGTIETFDTFDTENKKWLSEDEWKLKGAESYEKGKEGLN